MLAHHRLSRTARTTGNDLIHSNDTWELAHRLFHIIGACGSDILIQFCNQLYDQNIRYRNIAGSAAYPERDIANEHREIFDAVIDRDADLAVDRLIGHYRSTGKFLRDALARSD